MIDWLISADTRLFLLLNGRLHSSVLDAVMPAITTQENWYPVLGALWVVLLIWGGRRGRMAAAMLIVAVALADQLTCSLLKPLVGRLRPCNALAVADVRLLVARSAALSFPSAHAANAFAMACVVAWRWPKLTAAALAVAVAVGYSRVYVGLHYPLDVIGGAVVGSACGFAAIWAVVRLAKWWERRRAD
jgi:undecaprenyl-diphosphatase